MIDDADRAAVCIRDNGCTLPLSVLIMPEYFKSVIAGADPSVAIIVTFIPFKKPGFIPPIGHWQTRTSPVIRSVKVCNRPLPPSPQIR
jgi:hypothetical protein